jgi:hypothetical protein
MLKVWSLETGILECTGIWKTEKRNEFSMQPNVGHSIFDEIPDIEFVEMIETWDGHLDETIQWNIWKFPDNCLIL